MPPEKNHKKPRGLTARARPRMRELGTFTSEELITALEVQTHKEAHGVRQVIKDLCDRGEVERTYLACSGRRRVYKYTGKNVSKAGEAARRIYRAMHVSGTFSARKLAMLSDVDRSYASGLIRQLLKSGDLDDAGKTESPAGGRERVYRIRHRDEFYKRHVHDGG